MNDLIRALKIAQSVLNKDTYLNLQATLIGADAAEQERIICIIKNDGASTVALKVENEIKNFKKTINRVGKKSAGGQKRYEANLKATLEEYSPVFIKVVEQLRGITPAEVPVTIPYVQEIDKLRRALERIVGYKETVSQFRIVPPAALQE